MYVAVGDGAIRRLISRKYRIWDAGSVELILQQEPDSLIEVPAAAEFDIVAVGLRLRCISEWRVKAGASFDVASLPEFLLVHQNIERLPAKKRQDFIWDKIIYANPKKWRPLGDWPAEWLMILTIC